MTIVVGVLARDGAALAADVRAHRWTRTPWGSAQLTDDIDKVHGLGDDALAGFAGNVPLSQDLLARVDDPPPDDPEALAGGLARGVEDVTGEAVDRIEAIWGQEPEGDDRPFVRVTLAALDPDGNPRLLRATRDARVVDRTEPGFDVMGVPGFYVAFCRQLLARATPPEPSRDQAARLAHGTLSHVANLGRFRVRQPVRTWRLGPDAPPREVTSEVADADTLVADAMGRAVAAGATPTEAEAP